MKIDNKIESSISGLGKWKASPTVHLRVKKEKDVWDKSG